MKAKLINGALVIAPQMLTIGETHVWNPSDAEYMAQGWKPVRFTDMPTEPAPDGYYYADGWSETDAEIVQTWTVTELPDDIDEAEAFSILLGGAE